MNQSFYHYMMRYRGNQEKDELYLLAEAIFHDHGFPKQSKDYDEISNYLEMNVSYIISMSLFDEVWELYQSTK